MTKEEAYKVYDVLVNLGGADEQMRGSFIVYHTDDECPQSKEWRFCGRFGFGGKYYARENRIGYYKEDDNDKRHSLAEKIDAELSKIING